MSYNFFYVVCLNGKMLVKFGTIPCLFYCWRNENFKERCLMLCWGNPSLLAVANSYEVQEHFFGLLLV